MMSVVGPNRRILVSPRLELFFALAAVLDPDVPEPADPAAARWLAQARRKLDPGFRRRLSALAAPAAWHGLAEAPGIAGLEGDIDAAIEGLAALPSGVVPEQAGDVLRRFARFAFAAFWRHVEPDFQSLADAARGLPDLDRALGLDAAPVRADTIVLLPSLFSPAGYRAAFETEDGQRIALVPFRSTDLIVTPQPMFGPPPAASPPAQRQLDPALVFRALGDATRYAIASLIARAPMTGAELARRLGVATPTMTHHLQQLRAAGLLREEPRGNSVVVSLDRAAIAALSVAALAGFYESKGEIALRRSRRTVR